MILVLENIKIMELKFIELLVKSTQDQSLKESLLKKYMERLTEQDYSTE